MRSLGRSAAVLASLAIVGFVIGVTDFVADSEPTQVFEMMGGQSLADLPSGFGM
jgi:hypothetical protein